MRGEVDTEQLLRHDRAREQHMRRRTENGDEAKYRSHDDRHPDYDCTYRSERGTDDEQRCHFPAYEFQPRVPVATYRRPASLTALIHR